MSVLAATVVSAASAHHGSSIGSTVESLINSIGTFFSQLANLSWGSLLLGLALYAVYLLLRSRALWGALRAAYPEQRIRWRDVWGAYMVGYAINNVFPLGGGNVAQLFLTRMAIPASSYPTVATALFTGVIFDWFMGLLVMCFAFTQGVFPKPPDFSKLPAFDISFFAS
ncbi:MAG TPA: lysylphosphatidylglycerol synthase domain-containing protein, partial [Solirubrobacteraceae bacterium]